MEKGIQTFLALILVFIGAMSSQVAASETTIKTLPQVWALNDFEGTLLDATFSVDGSKIAVANAAHPSGLFIYLFNRYKDGKSRT